MREKELARPMELDTKALGVVDCHAHIFPPAGGASGFASVELCTGFTSSAPCTCTATSRIAGCVTTPS